MSAAAATDTAVHQSLDDEGSRATMRVAAEVIDGRGWRSWILAAVGLGLLAGCGRKADPAPAAPPPVVIGA